MKPRTSREHKNRDIDKDTVVAYHELIQGRIQDNLNGISIGPGQLIFKISIASAIFGFCSMITGILVITLRHRHVYLVSWDDQFLGPFFVILGLLMWGFSTFLCMLAKQRTNQYRADLAFRPIGDYGVAVVHKSKITAAEQKKSDLKSGTTPHNVRHPGRPGVNDSGNRGDYSKSRGYDNRGYNNDYYANKGRRDRPDADRGYRDHDYRDGRPDDRPRRPRDDGDQRPRRPREEGDRPPPRRPREEGDRPPRRPDDRGPRPDRRPDDRGPRPDRRPDDRGPRPDRRPDDRERRRPPPGSEEEKRREAGRRRYEEERRRRHDEDRRRAELRKEAEASGNRDEPSGERGVDVDGTRTYEIQTTVKLSRQVQETDESEL